MQTVISCIDTNTWGWVADSQSYTSAVPDPNVTSGGGSYSSTATVQPSLFSDVSTIQSFVNTYGLTGKEVEWARYIPNRNLVNNFMDNNDYSPKAKALVKTTISLLILDQSMSFEQAVTIAAVNELLNPITGDPIEFYLLAQYKNSNTLKLSAFSRASNSIQVGTYTLTPHYKSNGTLAFYTAVRWNSTGNALIHDIEFIIKPSGLANFQQKIDLYTASADLFYLNGTPSLGQISMAAGDYVGGLQNMWTDALTNPQYYLYLAHVFVGVATNLNAVESTATNFEGKISYTSQTRGSSEVSIDINNRSAAQYKQLISQKFPNSSWGMSSDGKVDILTSGNLKYTGRFENNSGYYYTIEYFRNDIRVGKFRFFN